MTLATRFVREPLLGDLRWADELFSRMFGVTGTGNGNGNGSARWMPVLDIHETADDYLIFFDLPGVKVDDVTIEYDDGVLTVTGARQKAEIGEPQRVERPYGQFVRTLTLPRGIDADAIVADFSDGVLQLRVPKPAEHKPKKIALSSGSKELTS